MVVIVVVVVTVMVVMAVEVVLVRTGANFPIIGVSTQPRTKDGRKGRRR